MIAGFNRYCESGDNSFGFTKEIIAYASPFWTTILIQTGTCLLFPFPIGKRIFLQRCARDYRQERGPRGRRGDCPGPTRAVQGGPGLRPLPSPRSRPACATAPGRGEPPARPIKGGRGPGRARCGAGPGFCLCTAAGPHAGEPQRRGSASFPSAQSVHPFLRRILPEKAGFPVESLPWPPSRPPAASWPRTSTTGVSARRGGSLSPNTAPALLSPLPFSLPGERLLGEGGWVSRASPEKAARLLAVRKSVRRCFGWFLDELEAQSCFCLNSF